MVEQGLKLVLAGFQEFKSGVRQATDEQNKLADSSETVAKKSEESSDRTGKAAKKMALAVVGAAAAAGLALVKFGLDSLQVAADFNDGIRSFEAVAGDSLSEVGISFDDVRKKALEMGIATRFSAQESLEAMTNLARGGVKPTEIMGDATQATLDLAAAAKYDLANAADIVASQLGVWGEEGVTATDIADTFTQVANATVSTVDDLRLGLAASGASAQAFGLSFEDTATTIGLLKKGFSSGSDAGTSFKAFLSSLIPKSKDAFEAMRQLNLVTEEGTSIFFDAQGQFIGMEKTAAILQDRLGGLSDLELGTATTNIFGTDASRAAIGLARAGAKGFQEAAIGMEKAGTAAEQAAKMNKGWNFVMDSINGTIQALQITVGTFLETALLPLAEGVLKTIGAFTVLVGDLISGKQTIDGIANSLLGPIIAFFDLEDVITDVQSTFQRVFDLIGSIVGTVMAQVATFVQNHGGEIRAFFEGAFNTIVEIVSKAMSLIQDGVIPRLAEIARFIGEHGAEIQAIFTHVWNFITGVVSGALAFISNLFSVFMAQQSGDGKKLDEAWKKLFFDLWESVKGIVSSALFALAGIIDLGLKAIGIDIDQSTIQAREAFTTAWQQMKEGADQWVAEMERSVKFGMIQVYNAIILPIQNAHAFIEGMLDDFIQAGVNIVKGLGAGIDAAGYVLHNAIVDLINGVLQNAVSGINGFITGIGSALQTLTGSNPLSGFVIQAPKLEHMSGSSVVNKTSNYNLTVNSGESTGSVSQDFAVMGSLA
jgi:TP901 family phage tail tape measure protein